MEGKNYEWGDVKVIIAGKEITGINPIIAEVEKSLEVTDDGELNENHEIRLFDKNGKEI